MRRASLLLVGLLASALVLGGLVAARFADPRHPDTVSRTEVRALLAPDPAAPLALGETDVVFFAVCTLRKDRLGLHGGPNPTSPFLDQLAAHGVVFDQHFAQAPWTRPSMGALFTGRWPRALRLDSPGAGDRYDMVLPADETLLAEHLRAAGYATVGVVGNPNLKPRFGFDQGFDHYDAPRRTYKKGASTPPSSDVVDRVLAFVDEIPADAPLYVRSVVLDGHRPRRARRHHRLLMRRGRPGLRTYDAALRNLDGQAARLLAALRARRDRPVLFVLAADHGEGLLLPRHHGADHGNHVYRSTVETPWVLHHPALAPRRVEALSMNIDIVPTILDLLGAPVPPGDGRSHAPRIRGIDDQPVHDAIFAETFFRRRHLATVYDGRHQLIRTYEGPGTTGPHRDALYTAADWRAEDDRADRAPAETRRLAERLDAWEEAQAAAAAAAGPGVRAEVDAETRAALEAIGYVE